jgi:hypothetical protein
VGTLPTLKPREVVGLLQGLGFAEVRHKIGEGYRTDTEQLLKGD